MVPGCCCSTSHSGASTWERAQTSPPPSAKAATGRAVIVASADIDELLDVADRIVVLHAGVVVHDGPAAATTRERYAALAADADTNAGAAA